MSAVAVGGQALTVRGRAATYDDLLLPLFGPHQAQNAAIAIAAVESFLGAGTQPIAPDVLAEGLANVRSPGRLQIVATEPTVLVDAAHNPHGAEALARAVMGSFAFTAVTAVIGVLDDKDAHGIIAALDPVVERFVVTQSESERAIPAVELAEIAAQIAGPDRVVVAADPHDAIESARQSSEPSAAVLVTGSITLVGQAISILARENEDS